MNSSSVGHCRGGELSHRDDGHRVRLDVLLSALQKGVRRCMFTLSLWAVVLLCRGCHHTLALDAITQCMLEETSALTEPTMREQFFKSVRRLRRQIVRKGLDVNTETVLKLYYDLTLELTLASKSRLCVHAIVASYAGLAEEARDLRAVLPVDETARLQYCFKQFKRHYEEKNEADALKWLTLVDLFGSRDSVHGTEKVWRFLCTDHPIGLRVKELFQMVEDGFVPDPYARRVALYEAVLYQFYPLRNHPETKLPPSARAPAAVRNAAQQFYKDLWAAPLEPALRHLIEWDLWYKVILDTSTAVGKNRDTMVELTQRFPSFPALDCGPPDYAGISHGSFILNDFAHCQLLTNRVLADPYESRARQFLADIERGHSLPVFGKGLDGTDLDNIRRGLTKLIQPVDLATSQTLMNLASAAAAAPVPAASASGGRGPRRRGARQGSTISVQSVDSEVDPQAAPRGTGGRPRANSADPVRSHVANKAPCPLPGFTVQHQEIVAGPSDLNGLAVTYCHLAESPVVGQHPRWFVGLSDRTSWVAQRASEMLTTIPIHLDSIKRRFGLPCTGMRFVDQSWLVMRDAGKGGPYATSRGARGHHEVVQWSDAGIVTLDSPTLKWTPALLEQTTKVVLFRALFRVADNTLNDLFWSVRDSKVYSWGEFSTSSEPWQCSAPAGAPRSDVLLTRGRQYVRAYVADDPLIQHLQVYWSQPAAVTLMLGWLLEWEQLTYELPSPSRPVNELPNATRLLENIRSFRAYLQQT